MLGRKSEIFMVIFGIRIIGADRPGLLRDVAGCAADAGANIVAVHHTAGLEAELLLEINGVTNAMPIVEAIRGVPGVVTAEETQTAGEVFGKRVIVIGGGAQVSQVALGAVSEADRHNIRGERISVDTIPLVGEARLADAVRAVARLPRVRVLVLAGSLMGGEIATAVREIQAKGIPVISLNMVGTVSEAADLVVSDPVQAGVMAVMSIADTASFDLAKVRGRRI
jgi:energy-converting hydrogenase B subunit Q